MIILKLSLSFLYYKGIIFPSYAVFKEKVINIDYYKSIISNSDDFDDKEFNKPLRKIILKNKKVYAYSDKDYLIWETPDEYKIQDFLWCDINKDNKNELVLLAWRAGRYGSFLPFWIKENDMSFDQHIFIYEFKDRIFKPIWKSSYIEADVREFYFDDEYNILTLLDKNYSRVRFSWLSWGLSSIKASKLDYDEKHDKVKGKLNLIALGDNLIHKQIYELGLKKNDFNFLYENIKEYLNKGNLKVINQETIFVDKESEYSDYPQFGTPIQVGDAIKKAGFNLVTLANNHILDKGDYGVDLTKKFYDDNKIDYIGIKSKDESKNYKIFDIDSIKVSVFNYTYGINNMTIDEVINSKVNSLADARQVKRDLDDGVPKSDVSIVFVHWGDEYNTSINEFQKKWANIFLSKGVDIVIGTHPHVLQKYEVLKDINGNEMLVYYSIGNFISYQKNIENLVGGIADVEVYKTNNGIKFKNYDLVPTITIKDSNYISTYLLNDYDKFPNLHIYGDYNQIYKIVENAKYSFDKNEFIKKLKKLKVNDVINLGRYEQDGNISNGSEEIEWVVMVKKDNEVFLTSKYILDYVPFDKERNNVKNKNMIQYKDTYMYYFIYNDFIKKAFTDDELNIIHNKNVSLACTYRYNSIGFDYTDKDMMKASDTIYARNKYSGENINEYWILNKCDSSNALDIETNREKFIMADGSIAYNGYRNASEEMNSDGNTNIYEIKGFRPFITIKY